MTQGFEGLFVYRKELLILSKQEKIRVCGKDSQWPTFQTSLFLDSVWLISWKYLKWDENLMPT
jgi:hypothetical protein